MIMFFCYQRGGEIINNQGEGPVQTMNFMMNTLDISMIGGIDDPANRS